ncbi:uncharacterized protein LOC9651291 [Selaginella moellendorffii]|nr:uncharacterized protein LOC9651291 [Selaginella moellendorffii]|eukprot:XP_002972273.2 uncharacterized protein LOC9651291 [Selaginella moellendorffii]
MAALSSLRSPLCSSLRQPRVRVGRGRRVRCSSRSSMAEDCLHALRLSEERPGTESYSSQKSGSDGEDRGVTTKNKKKNTLEELRWDHSFVRELPSDGTSPNFVRQVMKACYSRVSPSAKVKDPKLVAWSDSVAELLELDPAEFKREDFPLIFSGGKELQGSECYAQCYGGHQFGVWAGQLGDGRAITLGEALNSKNERWELQLKGAGKTPYSRMADGLAVLRSSVREFLCSEAMHHLGIPTTRALCLVTTGDDVLRDMFYDGNAKMEPGAVVCRVAPSFLRFGSYQIHAARDDSKLVRLLADYTLKYHFPDLPDEEELEIKINEQDGQISKNKYAAWFVKVAESTSCLVAMWQAVGFTHGVLNTDNMSVLGLTIDYGPFGFLDAFDPKYTPNTTDLPGRRYCFANQPDIGLWNILQFGNTLMAAGLLTQEELQYGLNRYADTFMVHYQQNMTKKLGLKEYNKDLTSKLLSNLAFDKVDYTNFFRALASVNLTEPITEDTLVPLKSVLPDISKERKKTWMDWLSLYREKAEGISDESRKAAMNKVNPKYVLRNYLCQSAIDAAEAGDFSEVRQLLEVMKRPFDEQPEVEKKYARLPPTWAYRPGVCMLSCSS